MIDKKDFQYWMGCIADRTNRVLSPPTYNEYYKALSGELTNEQFVEAARLVFRNAEFWPAPKQFIDAIQPDARLVAAQVFQWIQKHGHHNGLHAYWVAEEIEGAYGAVALSAFRAIGGGERFGNLTNADHGYALKEFCDAYMRARGDAAKPPADWRALPKTAIDLERRTSTALLRSGQPTEENHQGT